MEKKPETEDIHKDIEELTQKTVELYATDAEFRNIPAVENLLKFLMSE